MDGAALATTRLNSAALDAAPHDRRDSVALSVKDPAGGRAVAHVNAIATATPGEEIHGLHLEMIAEALTMRDAALFRRMAAKSGIARRWGDVQSGDGPEASFYAGATPPTAARMARYEREAPRLAMQALDALAFDPGRVTHLIVASCTGFMAPGLDQRIAALAGLSQSVERTVVGFMGCYAAVNALRLAHHIVRSEPSAQALVVTLELCSLHFQPTSNLERNLAAMLFGDGCAAALVSAEPTGIALRDFRAATIPASDGLITWRIGDHGFEMHLSGDVPRRIEAAMRAEAGRSDKGGLLRGEPPEAYDLWAVHAGGRTILDAVEAGLGLGPQALAASRGVLRDCGNMSSSTLMFVLARLMAREKVGSRGVALAFGPGLAAESFRFDRL